jgi:CO/xanthine dehydrogenase FAD-binding subunit
MTSARYSSPKKIQDAFAQLENEKGRWTILAGGTDLIPRMRAGLLPDALLDLSSLDLTAIEKNSTSISIGACVTHNQGVASEILKAHAPALIDACSQVGGPPIRNRATLGGNLANASPAADSATPLLVYDAQVVLSSSTGNRILPLAEFFTGPGNTALQPGELITSIEIPTLDERSADAFIKMGKRRAMAIAIVSVAVRIALDPDGLITTARIALGSVAPTPLRAIQAEQILEGQLVSPELLQQAARAAGLAASPIDDLRATAVYRTRMVPVLVRRALMKASKKINTEPAHD